MIDRVSFTGTLYGDLPHKFEAGTPDVAGAIGLARALDYIEETGIDAIARRERELLSYALEAMDSIPGLTVFGKPRERSPVVSFTVEGTHPHDLAVVLDRKGIAIRSGHHCTQPLMKRLGTASTARLSPCFYNTQEEIDILYRSPRRGTGAVAVNDQENIDERGDAEDRTDAGEPMEIDIQPTPNPNAFKFVLDRPVKNEGNSTYKNPSECGDNLFALNLFLVRGIDQLHFFDNTITVTKFGFEDWGELEGQILHSIRANIGGHDPDYFDPGSGGRAPAAPARRPRRNRKYPRRHHPPGAPGRRRRHRNAQLRRRHPRGALPGRLRHLPLGLGRYPGGHQGHPPGQIQPGHRRLYRAGVLG